MNIILIYFLLYLDKDLSAIAPRGLGSSALGTGVGALGVYN